jgi:hypothetical protein
MTTSRSFALAKLLRGGTKIDTASTNATNANTANAIVARDASGNFSAGTITTAAGDTATAASHYFVETASDGAIRPKTLANVQTEIVTTAAVNSAAATTVGTVTSGTWNGGLIAGQFGGTGVNNTGRTITLGGNVTTANTFTTSGNFALTLTQTGATNVTLPTTGTLATTGNLSQFAATTSSQLAGVISDETGSGALVFGTGPTVSLPIINNIKQGYSTTVTAAGTTTLTVNSNRVQFFTGTNTQVLSLPAPQTMTLGMEFLIVNNSTGSIEVRAANSATVITVLPGTVASCISIDLTAGNGAAGWNAEFVGFSSVTGTGSAVLGISPALTGSPTAPTATVGTNDTKIATTAFVVAEIANRGFDSANAIFLIDSSYVVNRITNLADTKLATIATAGKVSNSATTATNANTANAIVARDASGNFTAGAVSVGSLTSTGIVSGSELTSTNATADEGGQINLAKPPNATIAGGVTIDAFQDRLRFFVQGGDARGAYIDLSSTSAGVGTNLLGAVPGDGTLTLAVSGTGLSGSASFTANQSSGSTFTVTSNATSANTVSTLVARDASGNFSAGTITAALSGNATTATALQTARTIGGVSFDGSANINLPGVNTAGNQNTTGSAATLTTARTIAISGDVTGSATSFNGGANITISANITAGSIVSADFSSAASLIIYNSAGTALKTIYSPGS